MGKARLTLEEVKQFPTLRKLVDGSEGRNTEEWGMCKNNEGEITFGEASPCWVLLVSLDGLFNCASMQCGEDHSIDDIVLFYGVEYPLWEDTRFEFIILSEYEENCIDNPQIAWSNMVCS